eukprot:g27922.t1
MLLCHALFVCEERAQAALIENGKLQQEVKALRDSNSSSKADAAHEVRQLRDRLEALEVAKATAAKEIEELQARLEATKASAHRTGEERVQAVSLENARLQQEVKALQDSNSSSKADAAQELRQLRERLEALEAAKAAATKEAQQLQGKLEATKAEAGERLQTVTLEHGKLQQEVKALRDSSSASKAEAANAASEIRQLRERLEALEATKKVELASVKADAERLALEKEDLICRLKEEQAKVPVHVKPSPSKRFSMRRLRQIMAFSFAGLLILVIFAPWTRHSLHGAHALRASSTAPGTAGLGRAGQRRPRVARKRSGALMEGPLRLFRRRKPSEI